MLEITEEIKSMVAEITELEPELLRPDASLTREYQVDSLAALEIAVALEKRYGVSIAEEHLPRLDSIAGSVELVQELLARKAS
ncbi:acyl carrier protein [Desulfotomaculum copahuensis]|uniref:Carrier domain-containing protein n=1 Tax=Desulfotomaculum copahuensis TaxID=1838280 RepID=A0A1B7LFX0_9FIRM|nr:acyl carrier protein [Desulfotomaculum copahuensis]OAT83612.1 hypothetical protein A6M21_07980 [Desulfotomaculum copahuensis]